MSEPIHIISLGAGVQSSTMALMAAHGEITPMPKCAIFADTQDEPQSVYKWLDWLEKQLPFPVVRVTAGKLSEQLTTLKERRDKLGKFSPGGIPAFTVGTDSLSKGMMVRYCTTDFKVTPLTQAARKIAGIKRGQTTVGVIQWIGISRDEAHRMKPSKDKWSEHRWPLVDMNMTRQKCLQWMEDKGFPKPPRSACVFCPYHSDKEWMRLKTEEPEEFERAVLFERRFQSVKSQTLKIRSVPFLHSSRVPLDQVDFSTDEDHGQQVMFGNECEGMCGV